MKAFAIQGGFGIENLKLLELPDPKPGPGEVLVSIKSISLNYRDLLTVTGKYNPNYKLPLVPCSDSAGEVLEVGGDVTRCKKGDRVMGIFAQKWIAGEANFDELRSTLGGPMPGTFLERRIFPEYGLVKIPSHLNYNEAATLPCAALTAWNALTLGRETKPGDFIVIQGTGGVSLFALQFAKLFGSRTILTSSSPEKLEEGKKMGADFLINYAEKPNWSKEVRRITAMTGADNIIEVGGGGTIQESIKAVKPFGQISLIGNLSGSSGDLNLLPILMQNVRVQGIIVGSRKSFEEMNRAIESSGLKPVIDKVFTFEKGQEALDYMSSGGHFGKICIQVSE